MRQLFDADVKRRFGEGGGYGLVRSIVDGMFTDGEGGLSSNRSPTSKKRMAERQSGLVT